MGTRRRLITKNKNTMLLIMLSFLFSSSLFSCITESNEEKEEKYVVFDKEYEDCNIYQMVLTEGEYLYRFSLSGSCQSINKVEYLDVYTNLVSKNKNLYKVESGKMIKIEYYTSLLIDIEDITKIKSVTEEVLNCKLQLFIQEDEEITFRIE